MRACFDLRDGRRRRELPLREPRSRERVDDREREPRPRHAASSGRRAGAAPRGRASERAARAGRAARTSRRSSSPCRRPRARRTRRPRGRARAPAGSRRARHGAPERAAQRRRGRAGSRRSRSRVRNCSGTLCGSSTTTGVRRSSWFVSSNVPAPVPPTGCRVNACHASCHHTQRLLVRARQTRRRVRRPARCPGS